MKKPLWNVRTRLLLTLGLVVLPAAALILFSVKHLKSIQRDRAVEATFQRDFQQMLTITDKQLSERAYAMIDAVRPNFPTPWDEDVTEKLDKILAQNPWADYVFLFNHSSGTELRSQPGRMTDPDFRMDGEKLESMVSGWFGLEGEDMLPKFHKMEMKGERPYESFFTVLQRGDKRLYQPVTFFTLERVPTGHVVFGGIAINPEYLQHEFFPQALNSMMSENMLDQQHAASFPQAAVMIHMAKDYEPLAACSSWDGGKPEVEHMMEPPFPGLVLAIKYRGTTIAAITQRFLRTSYIIVGILSVLLIAGLYFTFRSVNKAMELAKLKSDIVSNVSHELRTPLSLIRLYAETLELGRIPDEQKKLEYYRIVRKESERLTALINNILDFSRIEAGKKEYEFRETDLCSLVRSTLDAYRYQIEQNGFTYEEHICDDLPPVRVDREAIARSLLNLVNNAIKYSSSEKYLSVSLYREDGSVKLDVVDHGIGIDRSEQNKVFDKFYRVCDPMIHENKGSGLGLSLVQHIVKAHGGEISVESTLGKGSKFTITLPLNVEAAPASPSRMAANQRPREVGA
jgi:signal transduction histidine kinase